MRVMSNAQSDHKHLDQDYPGRDAAVLDRLAQLARPLTLAAERLLPVLPALRPLLPGGGLRRGSTVLVRGSTALALALAAGPSAAGAWVAAAGLPDLGLLAASEAGLALDRLALVPDLPVDHWQPVLAALLDGVGIVLAGTPARLDAGTARRVAARARERGAVLIPVGGWPDRADLVLGIEERRWDGLGEGHGHLRARAAGVVATGRGLPPSGMRARLWLPAAGAGGSGPYAVPDARPAVPPAVPARTVVFVGSAIAAAWGRMELEVAGRPGEAMAG